MIEVLVSAIVVLIVAAAVFSLLNATARSAAEERHRSEAYAVAQEDQARLRSLRISELNRLNETRTVTLNGTPFSVTSTGVFVNDTTTTSSCTSGAASADYVKVATSVSWPSRGSRPAVTLRSIVSPANGSLDPSHGTLTITATNALGNPIPGIGLSGTGAGTFSGSTDSSGCAVFADQPSGNYTLTPSGVASGLVDKDGKTPGSLIVGVVAGATNSVTLLYDLPGSIKEVTFQTKKSNGEMMTTSGADSIVVFNTGMTLAKVFGTPGGSKLSKFEPTSLFPFTSPDTVYAGACGGNNPNPKGEANPPGAEAMASALIPANGAAPAVKLRLPALYLNVWTGKNAANKGSAFNNADVWIRDDKCSNESGPITRRYVTSVGTLTDPGLPWSTYDVCVDSLTGSGTSRRKRYTNVSVESLTTAPTLEFFLGEGFGAENESGSCP